MNQLVYNQYKIDLKKVTKRWLTENGFKKSTLYSTKSETVYEKRFPCYKWGIIHTLECEVLLYMKDGTVKINIYDYGTRTIYAGAYTTEDNSYEFIMRRINRSVSIKLKKLGIKRVK